MKELKSTDTSDNKDNFEQLKSKIITLKNNELLCAATGKACPKDGIFEEINKEMPSTLEKDESASIDNTEAQTITQSPEEQNISSEKLEE